MGAKQAAGAHPFAAVGRGGDVGRDLAILAGHASGVATTTHGENYSETGKVTNKRPIGCRIPERIVAACPATPNIDTTANIDARAHAVAHDDARGRKRRRSILVIASGCM